MVCGFCGGPLTQKNRSLLFLTGAAMLATYFLTRFTATLWPVVTVAMLAGAYMLVWGTFGHSQWCRHCKVMAVWRRKSDI